MSIFSNIRKSRQQAKEHNAKLAEKQKKEDQETASYRHVPTHAASDAFASAPPTWREAADRPRIIEQNRRRSAMAASGHPVNIPGPNFPRVASGLSYVSYPGQETPRSRMPRAYSYAGASSYPDGSRGIIHSIADVTRSDSQYLKQDSPLGSNSGSAVSQEDLEIRNSKASAMATPAMVTGTAHRLHPSSRSRRTSDASLERGATANPANSKAGSSNSSRDSRPPPSTRGFNAIPPSDILIPVQQIGTASSPHFSNTTTPTARDPRRWSTDSSRQNSSSSLPGLIPTSAKHPSSSASASASSLGMPPSHLYLNTVLGNGPGTNGSSFTESATAPGGSPGKPTNRSGPKVARFREIESPKDDIEIPDHVPPPAFHAQVVNFFPEPAAPDTEPTESKKSKSKKFSKGAGGRLIKKNRRSTLQAA